ncbi:hypothetical protein [Amycolatopsis roodepoortensis]|uniref:PH domain-containing protein n=2 Tax=Amycolatopsis roodepoortensis TaxID=700274 RepID=A0ABR9L887_9PSEU|nr:hypothetical protein [Amycolatopsis roodepoortensis]MBE1576899.1 hypothetical protein [Amycolatopsis roodepoortensis]
MITAIGMVAVLIVFGHPGSALPFHADMLLAFGVFLVTTQRIIFVASRPNGTEFRWVWLRYVQLPPKVKAGKAGGGAITFGGCVGPPSAPVLELRAIADTANVANLILQAQHRAAGRTYTQAP